MVVGRPKLSTGLTRRFGRGFSVGNPQQMRRCRQNWPIPQTLSAVSGSLLSGLSSHDSLPWSHYVRFSLLSVTALFQSPVMANIASKVLGDLRKQSQRDIVDLGAVRDARDAAAKMKEEFGEVVGGDEPSGHLHWMGCYASLSQLAFSLTASRHLTRLAERIEASEDEYMPGGPPMSPLTDSFHGFWSLTDTSLGLKKETLATVAIAVARSLNAPSELMEAWKTIADSYAGVYRIEARTGSLVTLVELVTGDERVVELADDVPGDPGQVWWTRLLPPVSEGPPYWTSIVTPYLFPLPDAEPLWLGYFERQLGSVSSESRAATYRRHMVQGKSVTFWFDFILDSYVGEKEVAVALAGVPDRPHSLPHSIESEEARENESPLERLRSKLTAISQEFGFAKQAKEDFDRARKELANMPQTPLAQWHQHEQDLLWAYSMFERPLAAGRGALDMLAGTPEALDEEEGRALAALQEGWFSLFEVVRIKMDEAIEVRDVTRRKRFWITERSATRSLSLGDCLGGWIMKEDGKTFLEGALAHVPRVRAAAAIGTVREIVKELRKDRSIGWRERQGQLAPWVSAMVASMAANPAPVTLVNHHGEAILLSEALYGVKEPTRVATILRAADKLEERGPSRFVWTDNDKDVVVGEFLLSGTELRVSCNSRERLTMLRDWVETTVGEFVQYRISSHQDPTSEVLDASSSSPMNSVDTDSLSPGLLDALTQVMQQRLEGWLDESIPALGNQTPRLAVRSAHGRDHVIGLLMEQERALKGDPVMANLDLSFLWTGLGLQHPDLRR